MAACPDPWHTQAGLFFDKRHFTDNAPDPEEVA